MLKLEVQTGDRGGYIDQCFGKYKTPNYHQEHKAIFSATNAKKSILYDFYQKLETKIVTTLCNLTRTGKTRIVLVEDDFFEWLKQELENQEFLSLVLELI